MPKAGSKAVRGICSSCKGDFALRLDGNVKIHGPFSNRCPSSGVAPLSPISVDCPGCFTPTSGETDVPLSYGISTVHPGQPGVKILGRVPHSARDVTATKLAEIFE